MLITVTGRMVRSHGVGEEALPDNGRVVLTPLAHGVWEGALRGRESVPMRITDGQAAPVDLTPGPWRVRVEPEHGPAWDSWQVELVPGMAEPVDLADLAPVVVIDGEKWAKGAPGASVTGGRDNGDGTVSFELSDGTYTDPVTVPPGPAGRGIVSISDPDSDSRVTITFTDDTTATVQAIRGAKGDKGDKGDAGKDSTVPGPANTLTIGTVTTGATGSTASATITGDAPTQTLNLTLPRGEQGIPGTATLPDTGWRVLPIPSSSILTAADCYLRIRRIGAHVTVETRLRSTGAGFVNPLYVLPSGFRYSAAPWSLWPEPSTDLAYRHEVTGRLFAYRDNNAHQVGAYFTKAGFGTAALTWITDDAWPTNLPGDPYTP